MKSDMVCDKFTDKQQDVFKDLTMRGIKLPNVRPESLGKWNCL